MPTAIVPLLAGLVLGLVQLLPLPIETAAWISPQATRWQTECYRNLDAESTSAQLPPTEPKPTLSLDRASTRLDLALLLLATIVFYLGGELFHSRGSRLALCIALATSGVALAFFGIVQQLTWNGKLYWTISVRGEAASFASFVDRNNAAGFLLICLAGAIGLVVLLVKRNANEHSSESRGSSGRSRSAVKNSKHDVLKWLNAPTLAASGAVGVIMAGILCSLSRGGALAMFVAAISVGGLVFFTQRRAAVLYFGAAVIAAGIFLVTWIGATNTIGERLASLLSHESISKDGRLLHWRDGLRAAADFWPAGSGLGTYRYVYLPYQQRVDQAWYYHAENQYLESLVEGGLIGLALLLGAIGLVSLAAWTQLRAESRSDGYAFGIAAMFALISQVVASMFDFGLYLPANTLAFALICGASAGRAAKTSGHGWQRYLLAVNHQRIASPVLGVILAAACLWGGSELWRAAATEAASGAVPPDSLGSETSLADLQQALERCESAVSRRPDEAEAQLQLGQVKVRLYRLERLAQDRNANSEATSVDQLWKATEPTSLHRRFRQLLTAGDGQQLAALRSDPLIADRIGSARAHFLLARQGNSLLPEIYLALAEISPLSANPGDDQKLLERARELAPSDPDVNFRCGILHLQSGRRDRAGDCWQTCLTLSDKCSSPIREQAVGNFKTEELITQILPTNLEQFARIGKSWFGQAQIAERRLLSQRLSALMDSSDLSEASLCYFSAVVADLAGNLPTSADQYARAIELEPNNATWRLEFADVLKRQGRVEEALEQARWSVRLAPEQSEHVRFLQQLQRSRLQRVPSAR